MKWRFTTVAQIGVLALCVFGLNDGRTQTGKAGKDGKFFAKPGAVTQLLPGKWVAISTDDDPAFNKWLLPMAAGLKPNNYGKGKKKDFQGATSDHPAIIIRIANWDAATDALRSRYKDDSIGILYISGHGSPDGGWRTKNENTHLSYPNLKEKHAKILKEVTKSDARIVFMSCDTGASDNMILFAEKTGRRIIANVGKVDTGNIGAG